MYFFPWELEQAITAFVTYYINERYHESLDNMTPADVFFGRVQEVKNKHEETKQKTLEQRRRMNRQMAQNDLSLGWRTPS
jgi:putative transposase